MDSDCGPDRHPTSSYKRAKNLMTVFAQADATRSCAVLSAISILVSSGLAMTPRFSTRDVVRQVRSARALSSAVGHETLQDSSEFLVDTSITLIRSPGGPTEPALAFDGTNFLAVWVDCRCGNDIYGARITPEGTVLDPAGFVVTPQVTNTPGSPAVAFDGTNFLVVWENNCGGNPNYYDIYGARVTTQGTVLDSASFLISQEVQNQNSAALAFDGANFLVVWEDNRSGTSTADIYGARLTPQGVVLDTAGLVISQAASFQNSPALAFDGENFLVAWEDRRGGVDLDIYATRVTPQGVVLDTSGIPVSTASYNQRMSALAFDGTNYLATWSDERNGTDHDIYGARVTPQGAVLDPVGFAVSQAAHEQYYPVVGFDGEDFLVVWQDHRASDSTSDIYGARVTPQGSVLDPAGLVVSLAANEQKYPAVAFGGANWLVAWDDGRADLRSNIYGARVTPQGAVLEPTGLLVDQAAHGKYFPALASDGEDFLVVWQDDRNSSLGDIYGARVTSQGAVLDPSGFVISKAANIQRYPVVGFNGTSFLVAWEDFRNDTNYLIYCARVTPEGTVLDTSGFFVARAGLVWQRSPAIASDGENCLVVWRDNRSGSNDIYGTRITSEGTSLDSTVIPIAQAVGMVACPAVSYDGVNFLVAWEQPGGGYLDLYCARVAPQGIVLDTTGIPISAAADNQNSPALAFDGENFLVVWTDERNGGKGDVYGARVSPLGTVLDSAGIAITQTVNWQNLATVAFDGENFLVMWQDYRNDVIYPDIYGAWVAPNGTVLDGGAVANYWRSQRWPRLYSGSRMLLVYQGWTGTVDGQSYNSHRIWGNVDPSAAIAEMTNPKVRKTNSGTSIVHGVLFLSEAASHTLQAASLIDISGRKVLELHGGANDVRGLAPGVYFVRTAQTQTQTQTIRKIVLAE
jgi:phosphoribosylformylglycinamidine (FGAM) synthase PurS component